MKTASCFWLALLAGCTSVVPHTQRYAVVAEATTPACSNDAECKAKMGAARAWLAKNGDCRPYQVDTDRQILSHKAAGSGTGNVCHVWLDPVPNLPGIFEVRSKFGAASTLAVPINDPGLEGGMRIGLNAAVNAAWPNGTR